MSSDMAGEGKLQSNKGFIRFCKFFCNRPFLSAFLFNLCVLLVKILTLDIKYEVSDDHIQDALLSGAFGQGNTPYMFFSNPFLGFILKTLDDLIPKVSFYFLFMEALGFISMTIVFYLLFKKVKGPLSVMLSLIFAASAANDLYILLQFTRVATVAGFAGGLLVLYGYFDAKKGKIALILGGTVLTVFSSFLRIDSIYVSLIFLFLVFLYKSFDLFRNPNNKAKDSIKKIGICFALCGVLVGVLYGLTYLGNAIKFRNHEYRDFEDFQIYRYRITDTWVPVYEDVKDDYDALGYDLTDYTILNTWGFGDASIYSREKLEKVGDINAAYSDSITESPVFVFGDIISRGVMVYWCTICLYAVILITALCGKRLLWPFVLLLSTFILLLGFTYAGRTVYRVESGIILCSIMTLLYTFEPDPENSLYGKTTVLFSKKMRTMDIFSLIATLLILGFHIPMCIPDNSLMDLSDEEYRERFEDVLLDSAHFVKEKYGFKIADRKPHSDLIELMRNDDEHYYYVDLYTGMQQLYFDYDPWLRPEKDMYKDQYFYFGSVAMRGPDEKYILEQNGIDPDNPYSGLIHENVYIVNNYFIDEVFEYVKKYYAPDAEIELVDEVDGFKIWNIYVPDGSET
ncbi:MAG: hypothetical protein K6G47_12675 [Clostridia bacterium]|nr:hypothetical protein [Clostridia bacterium]